MYDDHDFRRRNRKSTNPNEYWTSAAASVTSVLNGPDTVIPELNISDDASSRTYSPSRRIAQRTADSSDSRNAAAYCPDETMPCRDRTSEFTSCSKSMQMKLQNSGYQSSKAPRRILNETLQFNQYAKHIGQDLAKACAKLEQLSALTKRKSLFDDPSSEIEKLAQLIRQDITNLNKKIAQLQTLAGNQGYSLSTKKHAQSHSKSIVVSLQSKLATVSNEFKEVLEVRTENLKQQKMRRNRFTKQAVPSSLPSSASNGQLGSVLLADEVSSNGDVSVAVDIERDRYQQQLQLIDQQDTYIESRANAMANIESTIVELGTIFQQLAHMVQEQGELVTRIDSNVEEASLNVEAAHLELLKYFRSISQNRWLFIKVFGVLIVFFIVFVVFMT